MLLSYFPFKISLCWGKGIYHHDHQVKGKYSEKVHLAFFCCGPKGVSELLL